jgi:hypothetical protein
MVPQKYMDSGLDADASPRNDDGRVARPRNDGPSVMAGLDPAVHVFAAAERKEDADHRAWAKAFFGWLCPVMTLDSSPGRVAGPPAVA